MIWKAIFFSFVHFYFSAPAMLAWCVHAHGRTQRHVQRTAKSDSVAIRPKFESENFAIRNARGRQRASGRQRTTACEMSKPALHFFWRFILFGRARWIRVIWISQQVFFLVWFLRKIDWFFWASGTSKVSRYSPQRWKVCASDEKCDWNWESAAGANAWASG